MPFLHYRSDKSHNHSCRRSRVDFRSPVPEDPRIDAPLAESRFLQFARFLWPISFSCSDSLDKSFRARSRVDFRSPVPEDPRIDAPLAESRFLQFARFLWPISFSCSDSLDKSFRAER